MRIDVKGRDLPVSEDLRARVHKRFGKVSRMVSPLARMEVELMPERRNGKEPCCVEATLRLKGTTLRATGCGGDVTAALNDCERELARQVERHADKRRARRVARSMRTAQVQPGL